MGKIYYKVVRNNLKSIIVKSSFAETQYKVGEFVSSPMFRAPLCVFDNLLHARYFVNMHGGIIYECAIKTKYRKPWIPKKSNISTFGKFAELMRFLRSKKKLDNHMMITTALPQGTVCCKQVKLLRRVK